MVSPQGMVWFLRTHRVRAIAEDGEQLAELGIALQQTCSGRSRIVVVAHVAIMDKHPFAT